MHHLFASVLIRCLEPYSVPLKPIPPLSRAPLSNIIENFSEKSIFPQMAYRTSGDPLGLTLGKRRLGFHS